MKVFKFLPAKMRQKRDSKYLGMGGGGVSTPWPFIPGRAFDNGPPRVPLKKPMIRIYPSLSKSIRVDLIQVNLSWFESILVNLSPFESIWDKMSLLKSI